MSATAQVPQVNSATSSHKPQLFAHLKNSFVATDQPALIATPVGLPAAMPAPTSTHAPTPTPPPTPFPVIEEAASAQESTIIQEPVVIEIPAESVQEPPLEPVKIPEPTTLPEPAIHSHQDQPLTSVAAALPSAVTTLPDPLNPPASSLNPPSPTGGAVKEAREPYFTLEKSAMDLDQGTGLQAVEVEPNVEISPEVESYLQAVENHQNQLPEEVVLADSSTAQPQQAKYLAKPVIVLPITPDLEKEGAKKNPTFSIRWLVEFSHKVMKMFAGQVVYRHVET